MEANGLPSRTSILTAAVRAFGAREPDASVRNPDWVAERLIGPAELALIADHPISKAFGQDFQQAMDDPDIFGFAWLMLVRTRFIDELMGRAVRSGVTTRLWAAHPPTWYMPRSISRVKASVTCCALQVLSAGAGPISFARASA